MREISIDPIPMHCNKCGRTMMLPRRDAPDIPSWVASMTNTPCPDCDNGDFGAEEWFDAEGRAIDPLGAPKTTDNGGCP